MKALQLLFLRDDSGRGLSEMTLTGGTALLIVPTVENVGAGLAAVFQKLLRALQ